MKKITSLVLALVLCVSLCACGKSEAAKNTEAAIDAIGEVTLDSAAAIENAETMYEKLSSEDREDVENIDTLAAASDKYSSLLTEGIAAFTDDFIALGEALEERDIASCFEIIELLRGTLDNMHPTVYDSVYEMLEPEEETLSEVLDSYESTLAAILVNNTLLAQPAFVVTPESQGAWLVNDHGDFAAYNWWANDLIGATQAYEEYKEYVSKHVEVTDNGSSFSFADNDGNTVIVQINSTSSTVILQVRVPRF